MANLAADPIASARLQAIIGARRARIRLDDDTATVALVDGKVVPIRDDAPVDGFGATTRPVVLALLDARLDATVALQAGYITVEGTVDDLVAMLHAIEIILDAATRIPALRALAAAYRAAGPDGETPRAPVPDDSVPAAEIALLHRLGLCDGA